MAGSRLEKIGTVFSRTTGLLRTGALGIEDKPLWYDVYALHPPKDVPKYDRPAPEIQVRKIFYEEDLIRAQFHKRVKHVGLYTLNDDRSYKTQTQKFVEIYKNLKATEDVDNEKLFELALGQLHEKHPRDKAIESDTTKYEQKQNASNLVDNFNQANKEPRDLKNILKF